MAKKKLIVLVAPTGNQIEREGVHLPTSPEDIAEEAYRCYQAGANSYICKPTHLDEILSTAASLVTYWSSCAKLPSRRFVARPRAASQSK